MSVLAFLGITSEEQADSMRGGRGPVTGCEPPGVMRKPPERKPPFPLASLNLFFLPAFPSPAIP
jgi:hypothetical protein